jgi:hypothetical protein
MKTTLQKLLDVLPAYFDKVSKPIPAIILSTVYDGRGPSPQAINVDIENALITIRWSNVSDIINIYGLNLSTIAYQMRLLGLQATDVPEAYKNLWWFTLQDTHGFVPTDTINWESSFLIRFFSAIAQLLIDDMNQFKDALSQIYFCKATSFWLNYWGSLFGYERIVDETDIDYFNRTVYGILSLKTNNKALNKLVYHACGFLVDCVDLTATPENMFFTNRSTSITNSKANPSDILFNGSSQFSSDHNAFWVKCAQNLNNMPAQTKASVLGVIDRGRAAGCFPIYMAPTGHLITNKATDHTNDPTKVVGPKPVGWTEISVL